MRFIWEEYLVEEMQKLLNSLESRIKAMEEKLATLTNLETLTNEQKETIAEIEQACGIFAKGFEKLANGKTLAIPAGEYFGASVG
jgi:uncharacterized protein with von Willebrand factor type A (vWA) domain